MGTVPAGIFKAYDVRGVYPGEVNEQVVAEIAHALATHWARTGRKRKLTIVVGHDARQSSPSLYRVIVKTLYPIPYTLIIKADMITTPMLYFLVNERKAAGGIMVTASHNPKEYNGIKAVGPNARPVSGAEIYRLLN